MFPEADHHLFLVWGSGNDLYPKQFKHKTMEKSMVDIYVFYKEDKNFFPDLIAVSLSNKINLFIPTASTIFMSL